MQKAEFPAVSEAGTFAVYFGLKLRMPQERHTGGGGGGGGGEEICSR